MKRPPRLKTSAPKSGRPLVTVITPTYNHEKWIGDCIESVLRQTYPRWEMIVVNDGSTDRTREAVERTKDGKSRITLINQRNKGIFRLSETYNRALARSRGKYIAILEGDDVWEPDKLERQVAALETGRCVLAWGRAEMVNRDLTHVYRRVPVERPERERFYANVPPGSVLNLLLFGNPIPALTLLIRRDALNQIGGFQQSFNLPLVDLPTLLELSKLGEFCFDPATLGKWRVFGDQITKTYPVDILKNRAALSVHFLQNLDGETRKTLDLAECDLSSHFDSELQIAYARSGRYRLLRRDFRGARKDYLRAVFYRGPGNPAWRLRSIVGFVCSLFKKDVESLARALGKRTYQS